MWCVDDDHRQREGSTASQSGLTALVGLRQRLPPDRGPMVSWHTGSGHRWSRYVREGGVESMEDAAELIDVLRRLDPLRRAAIPAAALDDIAARATSSEPQRRQRRWRRAAIAGFCALLTLMPIGYVATRGASSPSATVTVTPAIVQAVRDVGARYPLPPGGGWDGVQASMADSGMPSEFPESAVEMAIARSSVCQWQGEWLAATEIHDTVRQQRAVAALAAAESWRGTDGAPLPDAATQRALPDLIASARAGDSGSVNSHRTTTCGSAS
jgi:hypothetical protein